jgi:hypothetical protein
MLKISSQRAKQGPRRVVCFAKWQISIANLVYKLLCLTNATHISTLLCTGGTIRCLAEREIFYTSHGRGGYGGFPIYSKAKGWKNIATVYDFLLIAYIMCATIRVCDTPWTSYHRALMLYVGCYYACYTSFYQVLIPHFQIVHPLCVPQYPHLRLYFFLHISYDPRVDYCNTRTVLHY